MLTVTLAALACRAASELLSVKPEVMLMSTVAPAPAALTAAMAVAQSDSLATLMARLWRGKASNMAATLRRRRCRAVVGLHRWTAVRSHTVEELRRAMQDLLDKRQLKANGCLQSLGRSVMTKCDSATLIDPLVL
ncbi:hypothetical protein CSQ89_18590 [Chitinimonas sp. BJB300]|nr:hypothetical protein CSQ89_18590 [Chitinimonas sp. BJB300]